MGQLGSLLPPDVDGHGLKHSAICVDLFQGYGVGGVQSSHSGVNGRFLLMPHQLHGLQLLCLGGRCPVGAIRFGLLHRLALGRAGRPPFPDSQRRLALTEGAC